MAEASTKRPPPANPGGNDGPNKRPNVNFSWLWKSDTFSDIKIVLVSSASQSPTSSQRADHQFAAGPDSNGDAGPHGTTATGTQQSSELISLNFKVHDMYESGIHKTGVLLEVAAHRVVVASASVYFRNRLLAWEQQQHARIKLENGGSLPVSHPAGLPACAVLEEVIQTDQLPAAEATLQFMYTQELPQPLNPILLLTVTRLAERWDMPQCTQFCLQQLSSLTPQQLPASLIAVIMADDLPKSVLDQPLYNPLLEACKQRMLQLFGSVQAVLIEPYRLAMFCKMPFSAVKVWAQLDELRVDSENSIALLITHWWQYQSKASGTNNTAPVQTAAIPQSSSPRASLDTQTKTQLSSLLRLNQLSASFFTGVLNQLPWFAPPQDAFNILCMCRALHPSKGQLLQQPIKDRLPAAWLAKPRTKDDTQVIVHKWELGKEELEQLHKEAETGRVLKESPGLCWCGYMWHLCLSLNSQKDVLWVGIRVRPGIPSVMQMPSLMEAKFTIAVKEAATKDYTRKETLNFADGAALQPSNCNGSPRLLQVPASPSVRQNSNPPPTLLPDGKLQLQVTLEMMQ